MLQEINGTIVEQGSLTMTAGLQGGPGSLNSCAGGTNWLGGWPYNNSQIYWQSYPLYITTDKTAKAIEILKTLQADKFLEVKSVPRFIELVEKISAIL